MESEMNEAISKLEEHIEEGFLSARNGREYGRYEELEVNDRLFIIRGGKAAMLRRGLIL